MIDFAFTISEKARYPEAPFHPDSDYPEFGGLFKDFDDSNLIYKDIRDLFINKGYDEKNLGTSRWNPFRGYIEEGQLVVIKPNLVYQETNGLCGKDCIITHASIIRPILDYLLLLQKSEKILFKIIIADVPILGADFDLIIAQNGLKKLTDYFNGQFEIDLKLIDLRNEKAIEDESGFIKTISLNGDPMGYSKIHLHKSFLDPIAKDYKRFGVSGYGRKEAAVHHKSKGDHYYYLPNSVLAADLFINVPKIKTHKKAGVSIALKNLIGITGEKGWIPHYRRGSIKNGGDEYDDNQVWLKAITTKANLFAQRKSKYLWKLGKRINALVFKKYFRKDLRVSSELNEFERKALFLINGDWYGNDTIWRPILDLNYILLCSDKLGNVIGQKTRRYICISDGIIAGEGDGPLSPFPKNIGLISLSENPVINDICLSKIMGFNWKKIPQLKRSVELQDCFEFDGDVDKIKLIKSNNTNDLHIINFNDLPVFKFIPAPGWINNI